MKAIFIPYDQAHKERILGLLEKTNIRGFTLWDGIQGKGNRTGEPHYGSHAWPTLNAAVLTVVPDEKVAGLLQKLQALDKESENLGLHAFVWNVEQMV
ncbi:MAG: hypothetical protein LBF08_01070 [Dysgonamonadaceae bacterium]|jgi:hypothetical protein|nr:hypothetical protein [Dysgonamonadaceae bacterium]